MVIMNCTFKHRSKYKYKYEHMCVPECVRVSIHSHTCTDIAVIPNITPNPRSDALLPMFAYHSPRPKAFNLDPELSYRPRALNPSTWRGRGLSK